MPHMNKEEVAHLANLARITLTAEEKDALPAELSAVVEYVSVVSEVAGEVAGEPALSARYNVFREDAITNEPGAHTKDLMAEMPHTEGDYLKVRKILKTD